MGVGEMSEAGLHRLPASDPRPCRRGLPRTARSPSSAWTGATSASCSPPGGVFSELKNLCVWNKTNGGMGSFYRSKHELVLVFKVGDAPHTNSFGLGRHRPLPHQRLGLCGRQHVAAWTWRGACHAPDRQARRARGGRHPGLLQAGRDVCSIPSRARAPRWWPRRSRPAARLVEFDPAYCDQIVRRFEQVTGKQAKLAVTGQSFETVAEARALSSVTVAQDRPHDLPRQEAARR